MLLDLRQSKFGKLSSCQSNVAPYNDGIEAVRDLKSSIELRNRPSKREPGQPLIAIHYRHGLHGAISKGWKQFPKNVSCFVIHLGRLEAESNSRFINLVLWMSCHFPSRHLETSGICNQRAPAVMLGYYLPIDRQSICYLGNGFLGSDLVLPFELIRTTQ